MALSNLPLEADVQVIVDWLEYKVLTSEYFTVGISDLQRIWDTRRNAEDLDFENGSSQESDFTQLIFSEINKRIKELNESYPFALSESGESLEVKPVFNEGSYIYLFCLLLSHVSQGEVLNGSYLPTINGEIRDLFQACSTIAAAGEVDGHSYSFGFPRPDHTGFLDKLKIIYASFGEGKVVDVIPKGASSSTKDDQIDVIAWKDRPDGAAGKIYLLGQVASGNNWPNKSIKGGAINRFNGTWFGNPQNSSEPIAALFIPYCVLPEDGSNVQDRLNILTHEFGIIHYRNTLPSLFQRGFDLAKINANLVIERITDVPKIIEWVNQQLQSLKAATAK